MDIYKSKIILLLAIFVLSACGSSPNGTAGSSGSDISSISGGVNLADLFSSPYDVCQNHNGLNMLSDYEYQSSLITKRIYLGGHAQNTCDKSQMSLVYIETKLLTVEGNKNVSWAYGNPPQRHDNSGRLPDQVTATEIKSTVTSFQIISQTLFSSGGFSDTTGSQVKSIVYVDNSATPNEIYTGYAAAGYDADGYEILLLPTNVSSQKIFQHL